MNKPAPKEPSMDEILSSIRQIIADDDAAVVPRKPAAGLGTSPLVAPAPPIRPALAPRSLSGAVEEPESEPLALSTEQIMLDAEEEKAPSAALSFAELLGRGPEPEPEAFAGQPELVDPDDVTFEMEDEPEADDDPMAMFSVALDEPVLQPLPLPVMSRPAPTPAAAPAPRPQPTLAQAAPMPDPTLSRDMAEQLLDTATQSAVKSTFSKLNGLSMAGSGVTLEAMMREMLRPMLKEWLDENLPAVVERMVEREIARISRGGE